MQTYKISQSRQNYTGFIKTASPQASVKNLRGETWSCAVFSKSHNYVVFHCVFWSAQRNCFTQPSGCSLSVFLFHPPSRQEWLITKLKTNATHILSKKYKESTSKKRERDSVLRLWMPTRNPFFVFVFSGFFLISRKIYWVGGCDRREDVKVSTGFSQSCTWNNFKVHHTFKLSCKRWVLKNQLFMSQTLCYLFFWISVDYKLEKLSHLLIVCRCHWWKIETKQETQALTSFCHSRGKYILWYPCPLDPLRAENSTKGRS